ncbi:MAG: UMP kinase [Acholeplasmatales bacterium]|nr:UMP kinase [Acholeplasmataceae bacterium]MCK9234297.1 UMP kinase [Acholeplasmataceae bacterium]MCK9288986.1 UMP kinase [Acholeplasmataceae bacterium]MCK9427878.1 UMP kinase [Acholeplasmataceae bacterium]MDY0114984.1 UMP kinase [Acholeplasmatales bacterium]
MIMYKRVIIKVSGEALKGDTMHGIDPKTMLKIARDIKEVHDLGVEIGIVVGGGNIWRGKSAASLGMDRAQADYMGMLATIMNGLALQDALEKLNVPSRVASAIEVNQVSERYIRKKVEKHLKLKTVYIFVGGTGSPYFTTDTAAALRAAELNAEVILMGKNGVSGVYDKDPKKYQDAIMFNELTHKFVLEQGLEIMDSTAASLCKENKIDLIVFNIEEEGNLKKAVLGKKVGTKVT